jgi:hypothetical protein
LHFLLLREWLKVCDESHHGHTLVGEDKPLPKRVIDVGDVGNPSRLLLLLTKDDTKGRYIALSHRWGGSEALSTQSTIENLCKGIEFDLLPKTFQDAIVVTRRLGVQYLWIDSLCIIQNDDDDWIRESKKMEAVFASAYCTIAATSAKDSTEGFLIPRSAKEYVRLQDGADSQLYVYVGTGGEIFDRDVEKGELNKRAWVLQERALSRRTIHFTTEQTYWECGSVVCCETLVQAIK